VQNKIKDFSVAKSPDVAKLIWADVIGAFKLIFKDTDIKIIICNGTLRYVPFEKRDEIFAELHISPIGGYKGVSKTFHRIRQEYFL